MTPAIIVPKVTKVGPKITQKRPIYVVKHQVRDLARPYNLCHFVPHLIRFHMGYGANS